MWAARGRHRWGGAHARLPVRDQPSLEVMLFQVVFLAPPLHVQAGTPRLQAQDGTVCVEVIPLAGQWDRQTIRYSSFHWPKGWEYRVPDTTWFLYPRGSPKNRLLGPQGWGKRGLKSSRGAVQNRFRLACGTQPADVPVVKNAVLKLGCLAVRKRGPPGGPKATKYDPEIGPPGGPKLRLLGAPELILCC